MTEYEYTVPLNDWVKIRVHTTSNARAAKPESPMATVAIFASHGSYVTPGVGASDVSACLSPLPVSRHSVPSPRAITPTPTLIDAAAIVATPTPQAGSSTKPTSATPANAPK